VVSSLGAGGMENGVVNLCNRLDTARFAPSICVLRAGGALEARVDTKRVRLVVAERRFGNDPKVPFQLATHLRRHRIDIVHTHAWGTLVEGFVAAKLAGVPVLIHGEHGTIETRWRNLLVQRWLWRNVDQVTAVSSALAAQLVKTATLPSKRIHVINNGVDTERFRPLGVAKDILRKRFGLPVEGLLVTMVARLIPLKDHAGVMHAVAKLRGEGVDVRLAFAGDGPMASELEQLAAVLSIADRVHFMGRIDSVAELLNAADIFVSNSHREGMSNTVLEGMACGLPVVATRVGANPDLLDEGTAGLLVPPRRSDCLALALRELAKDSLRRQFLAQAALRRARDRFSILAMLESYSHLYYELALRQGVC